MCEDKLLSVIVPVYKTELYLDRCINSIVNQTYTNLEIILVDDGSPDRCPEICDEWAQRDNRISVIHQKNSGVSVARNVGIQNAKGEYVTFVDSDDYINIDMYKSMIESMYRNGAEVVCCGKNIVFNDKKVVSVRGNDGEIIYSAKEAIKEFLLDRNIDGSLCDKIYKKQLFNNIIFPEDEIYEDMVTMPKILGNSNCVVYIGEPYYNYCQNGESIIRSSYSNSKSIVIKHFKTIEEYLKSKYTDILVFFDVFQAKHCQSVLYLLLDNKEIYVRYKDDYNEFYKIFKNSFKAYIKLGNLDKLEKIKACLIYYKLYYFVHKLKKIK